MRGAFPILIDVDGVLLDWRTPFLKHIGEKDIAPSDYDLSKAFPSRDILRDVERFHFSSHFQNISLSPGVAESVHSLRRRFPRSLMIAVTSCGTNSFFVEARKYQLRHLPLDSIICLPLDSRKATTFSQFTLGLVIEDHIGHAKDAADLGHRAILLDRPYNQGDGAFTRVTDWQEVLKVLP